MWINSPVLAQVKLLFNTFPEAVLLLLTQMLTCEHISRSACGDSKTKYTSLGQSSFDFYNKKKHSKKVFYTFVIFTLYCDKNLTRLD